jgi:hypothetical protein
MKHIIFILSLLVITQQGFAQKEISFKPLRYDEDYSYLKKDSTLNWYKRSKYIPLSKNNPAYISFGGEIRYQYFTIKNADWGDAAADGDDFLFSRFLLHADLHAGTHFRAFVQLQSSMTNGKTATSPVEEDPLELHQAFIDVNINAGKKDKLIFRLGRQEFSYGSQRLVAVRDGPNNRQSFDGIKTIFITGNYKADLFYSNYVKANKGLFDDSFNKDTRFWGTYITRNKISFLQNIDLYYLGLWKRKVVFNDGSAKELRHSIGSRIWSSTGSIKYDIEGLYQFGKFGEKDISAWTLSVNAGYKLNSLKLKPEVALKTELISGDANYGDDKLQTFNPLFPRGAYFGLASLIGPSNLFDIHPSVTFEITKTLHLDIDYDLFWRYSIYDGIYTPGVALIYPGKNNPYRFIGGQLSPDIIYTPNNFLYFRGEFTWFNPGSFLKAAGAGKNILFTGITAQLKF